MLNGTDIKIARIRAHIRQFELADTLGIGESKLSLIESGRRTVPLDLIPRIEEVLGEHLHAPATVHSG